MKPAQETEHLERTISALEMGKAAALHAQHMAHNASEPNMKAKVPTLG